MGSRSISEAEIKRTIDAYQEHGCNATHAARKLGISQSTMRERVIKLKRAGRIKDTQYGRIGSGRTPASKAMSRDEFQSTYDTNTKMREAIRQGMAKLTDDDIVRDTDFRAEWCGIGNATGWRSVAEEDEFMRCQFWCDGVRWATPDTVEWAIDNIPKARPIQ